MARLSAYRQPSLIVSGLTMHDALDKSAKKAAAEWTSEYSDWKLFCSLTFGFHPPKEKAHQLLKSFCQEVAGSVAHDHLLVALAAELQPGGRLHFHVLFGPLPNKVVVLPAQSVARLWTHGLRQVSDQPTFGAVGYLTGHRGWTLAIACTRCSACCRRRGCRQGGRWPTLGELLAD